jgi:hypothetical protein
LGLVLAPLAVLVSHDGRPSDLEAQNCALQASQQEGEITKTNVAVAVVGKDRPFALLESDALEPYVAQLEADQPAGQGATGGDGEEAAAAGGDDGDEGAAMES